MSLMVSIIAKDTTFDTSALENQIQPPFNFMFGFESWRQEVWGHEIMKTLGCTLIPTLDGYNVYAFDEEVAHLKNEFQIILNNLATISSATNMRPDAIEFRTQNAMEAIRIAENNLDKVGIALW